MINGKSILGIIPARGGSKRLPGKHTRIANGKPLIAWTIEEAKKSIYIDRLIVSSDCQKIIKIARLYNCEVPFIRPSNLSDDEASSISVLLHALKEIEGYDFVMLLQPTSPLRNVDDIDNSIELCEKKNVKACVSMTLAEQNPYWMFHIKKSGIINKIIKKKLTQTSCEKKNAYILNGAIYIACVDWIKNTKSFYSPQTVAHIMPIDRSIDIDTEEDFSEFLKLTRDVNYE